MLENKPTQVTLVPDAEDAITSNAGWDTIKHKDFLVEVIKEFKQTELELLSLLILILNWWKLL